MSTPNSEKLQKLREAFKHEKAREQYIEDSLMIETDGAKIKELKKELRETQNKILKIKQLAISIKRGKPAAVRSSASNPIPLIFVLAFVVIVLAIYAVLIPTERMDKLENEIFELEGKVYWYDDNCEIIVIEEGFLHNTYHKYDCDRWRDLSVIVCDEDIVYSSSEYIRCVECH